MAAKVKKPRQLSAAEKDSLAQIASVDDAAREFNSHREETSPIKPEEFTIRQFLERADTLYSPTAAHRAYQYLETLRALGKAEKRSVTLNGTRVNVYRLIGDPAAERSPRPGV